MSNKTKSTPSDEWKEFIAPFPLEVSRERLEKRSEKPALQAVKSVQIDTWGQNGDTVGFLVTRPEQSPLSFNLKLTRVQGLLLRQTDDTTQVFVQTGTVRIGYLLLWIYTICFSGLIAFFLRAFIPSEYGVLIALGLAVIFFLVQRKAFHREEQALLAIVFETLE